MNATGPAPESPESVQILPLCFVFYQNFAYLLSTFINPIHFLEILSPHGANRRQQTWSYAAAANVELGGSSSTRPGSMVARAASDGRRGARPTSAPSPAPRGRVQCAGGLQAEGMGSWRRGRLLIRAFCIIIFASYRTSLYYYLHQLFIIHALFDDFQDFPTKFLHRYFISGRQKISCFHIFDVSETFWTSV
jgi:hypothetical protein